MGDADTFTKAVAMIGKQTSIHIWSAFDDRQIFSQSDEDGTRKIWNTTGQCKATRKGAVPAEELTDMKHWNAEALSSDRSYKVLRERRQHHFVPERQKSKPKSNLHQNLNPSRMTINDTTQVIT